MDSGNAYYSLTPAEREAQREEQQSLWRRVFIPLEKHYFGLSPAWLVQDWIPVGILASPPKQGKTALATALALSVATGTPFAGMPCNQGGVLWLSQEESMWDRQRLMELCPDLDPLTPIFTAYDHLPIDQEETMELLAFWVEEASVKLIVVDPLHGATSGRSLSDGWSARKTLDLLRKFCFTHNVTALVLHHSKRAAHRLGRQRVAESDQLAATSGMNIVLSTRLLRHSPRPSEGEGPGVRVPEKGEGPSGFPPPAPGHSDVAPAESEGGGQGEVPEIACGEPANTSPRGEDFDLSAVADAKVEESRVLCPGSSKGEGPSINPPRPTAPNNPLTCRIVTLDCTGRGPFANRTLHLLSDGPLSYALQEELPEGDPMQRSRVTYAVHIRLLLEKTGPLTSAAIIAHLDLPDNSARVALSRLVRDGTVRFVVGPDGERTYHLVKPPELGHLLNTC